MYSQLGQDIWAVEQTAKLKGPTINGFFVEFGAGNGVLNSNTLLLEESFTWKGILAEPCRSVREQLIASRKKSQLFPYAIGAFRGRDNFKEVKFNTEFSTLEGYNASVASVSDCDVYQVQVVTLSRLLELGNAPYHIDYLSVDTEGSEYDILKRFDLDEGFTKYDIRLISVEHNNTGNKKLLFDLLTSKGYRRDREVQWDDWYIKG